MGRDIQKDGLKVILLSALLSEAIDDMKGTTLYKQEIKQVGNRFQKMIEPYVKQIDGVYDADPELATNIFRETELFIEKLTKMNLVDYAMINQIHDHYSENKKEWQDNFSLQLTKLKN